MTDEISKISKSSDIDRQSYVIYMPKFVYDIVLYFMHYAKDTQIGFVHLYKFDFAFFPTLLLCTHIHSYSRSFEPIKICGHLFCEIGIILTAWKSM